MVSHHLMRAFGTIVFIYTFSIGLAADENEVRERQKDGKGLYLEMRLDVT